MLGGIVSGVIWFGLFSASHVAVFHLKPVEHRSHTMLLLYAAGLLGHLLTMTALFLCGVPLTLGLYDADYPLLNAFAGVVTMGCLFVLYTPCYYTFAASQSIQAIIRIHRSSSSRLSLTSLVAGATTDGFLRQRLESMVKSGNLVREGDRYRPTEKARRLAAFFRVIERVWRLDTVG